MGSIINFGKDDLISKDLTLIPFPGPLSWFLGWFLGRGPENEFDLKLPVRFLLHLIRN